MSDGDANADDPLPWMRDCAAYIDCIAVAAPGDLQSVREYVGPDGSCWDVWDGRPQVCVETCVTGLEHWQQMLPDEPRCLRPGAGDSDDIGETYLLAVALDLDPDTPLQFVATFDPDGAGATALVLQPLALDVLSITSPRDPFGDPLVFSGVPVVEDRFEVDLGSLLLPGATNPVTGSDMMVEMSIAARIDDDGFICGTVEGMVMDPLSLDLAGSTFAAVPIDSASMLPLEVPISCARNTVTDGS